MEYHVFQAKRVSLCVFNKTPFNSNKYKLTTKFVKYVDTSTQSCLFSSETYKSEFILLLIIVNIKILSWYFSIKLRSAPLRWSVTQKEKRLKVQSFVSTGVLF